MLLKKFGLIFNCLAKILLQLGILIGFTSLATAQVDPKIKFKTIQTLHFEIIYDAEFQDLAEIYANRLEIAFDKLKNHFEMFPEKTIFVLDDRTDLTNGAATVLPYPMIVGYPVLPPPNESIGSYGDWASELVTHEYTHILAMYQKRDIVSGLSNVFGSIMAPNILLPRWWHEGIAVEMETRYSQFGRLRSPMQDAWLRSYVLDKKLENLNLAKMNEVNIPTWPYGARPYLFGSIFWSEIMNENGPDSIKKLSWLHGGRAPYILSSPAEEVLSNDYAEYFEKVKTTLTTKVQSQLEKIQKSELTNLTKINLPFVEAFSPSLSPDGLTLSFIAKDETLRRSIQFLVRKNTKEIFSSSNLVQSGLIGEDESSAEMKAPIPKDESPVGNISRISWFPNSQKILFDKVDAVNQYYEYSDLYTYDLQSKKTEQLTHSARAREGAISPDGRFVSFVSLEAKKTNISILNFENKKIEVVYSPSIQDRCSHPSFLNNRELVFNVRKNGIERTIKLDLESKTTTEILKNFSDISSIEFSRNHLVFNSSNSGIPNVYSSDATSDFSKVQMQTNTLTAVQDSAIDWENKIGYASVLSSKGLELSSFSLPEKPLQVEKLKGLFSDRYPTSAQSDQSTPQTYTSEDYSSFGYLIPKYWLPFIYFDGLSAYLSASTSANDPLLKQAWSTSGTYSTYENKLSYAFSYFNQMTPSTIQVSYIDLNKLLIGSNLQRSTLAQVTSAWELDFISTNWQSIVGYSLYGKNNLYGSSKQNGPTLGLSYKNYSLSGAQISPESGRGGSLFMTSYLSGPELLNYNQLDLSYVEFFSKWLPKRHAIMLKIQSMYIDQKVPLTNYAYTDGTLMNPNQNLPQFTMRGYLSGTFQGRILNQGTLEYRFPIYGFYNGPSKFPLFFKKMHMAVFFDGISLEGITYDTYKVMRSVSLNRNFWSTGAEVKMDITLGYHFPLTVYAGAYFPLESALNDLPMINFGIYL